MKKASLFLSLALLTGYSAHSLAAEGTLEYRSIHSVSETADRLQTLIEKKGLTLFNRISHSSGAKRVGVDLRDTELLIFGNPKVGSPLMQCNQTIAIDLPQKVLIWKTADSQVWLSYNDPAYLAARHKLGDCGQQVIATVSKVLKHLADTVTQ